MATDVIRMGTGERDERDELEAHRPLHDNGNEPSKV